MVIFEQDFEEMLRNHQASLDDRKKFTALVKDLFPDQAKNVNLLLMAYNMGIAQDIQIEYSCAMKSHFRKFGNQMSGSGNHLCNYASLLA